MKMSKCEKKDEKKDDKCPAKGVEKFPKCGIGEKPDDDGDGSSDDSGGYRFQTAPFDPRFPNTNQTKHCFVSFLDYKKCIKLRGEDFPPCEYFRKVYTSLCPNSWVEKWESQIEEGKFPVPGFRQD